MNQNTEYEKLVALIETTLNQFDNVTVEHDVNLNDKDGNSCQIDVLIEFDLGERFGKKQIAVECKNKGSRKVERQQMGAFIEMIDSLNISKGIYVARKGFQQGARIKAEKSNRILLYTLDTISEGDISNWVKNSPLTKLGINPIWTTLDLNIDSEDEEITKIDLNLLISEDTIFEYNGERFLFKQFLINEHEYFLKRYGTDVIFNGRKKYGKNINDKQFEVNQIREYENDLKVIINGKKFNITKTIVKYMSKFITEKSVEHFTHEYKSFGMDISDAEVYTAKFSDSTVNFVKRTDDEKPIGYVQKSGSEEYEKIVYLGRLDEIKEEE